MRCVNFFQVQIHYTKKDGMKGMKVITRSQKVTADRQKMEDVTDLKELFIITGD